MIIYVKMLQRENRNLILQENLIRDHYRTLEYQLEQTRRIRHDIANHIYTIEQLMNQSEEKDLIVNNYKNELEKTYLVLQGKTFCEEILIDSAIKNKLRECLKKQIKTEWQAQTFSVGDIERMDMLGLIYNVFDNALEACEQVEIPRRWIRVSIKNEGDKLFFLCHNSKNPNIYLKKGEKTIKKDKQNHGIGKDIMRSIVKKYQGSIYAEEGKEEYKLEIICRCKCEKV